MDSAGETNVRGSSEQHLEEITFWGRKMTLLNLNPPVMVVFLNFLNPRHRQSEDRFLQPTKCT